MDSAQEEDCGFPYSKETDCTANKTEAHPLGCCWHEGGLAPSGHWCVAPVYPPTNSSGARIAMKQPCFWNLVNRKYQPMGGAPPTSGENVREHLSAPGEWYYDKSRATIYYIPLAGEDMASAHAVVADSTRRRRSRRTRASSKR